MATITLEYNPRTKGTVDFLNRMRESGLFAIKTPHKRESDREGVMKDVEMDRVYDEVLITKGLQQLSSLSNTFNFLNNEPELYSVNDLKIKYS